MGTLITDAFLDRVRSEGALALAALRLRSVESYEPLPKMSIWSLVCEEMVDTEYSAEHYERVLAELLRRNLGSAEIEEMRIFAWRTAGWLNFDKMVWDWCSLDEADILRAIEWQVKDGVISDESANEMKAYIERYAYKAKTA
jgi:hypothetical protein